MNTKITKQDYDAIMNTLIDLDGIAHNHFLPETIAHLELMPFTRSPITFANLSSFAVLKPGLTGTGTHKTKENIAYLNDWDAMVADDVHLKAGIVLLGVNPGAKANGMAFDKMEMFQDYSAPSLIRYKNAMVQNGHGDIYDQVIAGSYATDLIKGMPTETIKHLEERLLKASSDMKIPYKTFFKLFSEYFCDILEQEFTLLGNKTRVILVMGAPNNPETNLVNRMLVAAGLDKKYLIQNIHHYAARATLNTTIDEHLMKVIKTIMSI